MIYNNGNGHLYDDSSAPSLHGKNREIGAKEVKIKVSMPFNIIKIKFDFFNLNGRCNSNKDNSPDCLHSFALRRKIPP